MMAKQKPKVLVVRWGGRLTFPAVFYLVPSFKWLTDYLTFRSSCQMAIVCVDFGSLLAFSSRLLETR